MAKVTRHAVVETGTDSKAGNISQLSLQLIGTVREQYLEQLLFQIATQITLLWDEG